MDLAAILAFVNARLDEWEAAAKAATPGPWTTPYDSGADGWLVHNARGKEYALTVAVMHSVAPESDAAHIALNDPAFVLADVASKRRIVERAEQYQRWAQNEDTPAFKALAAAGDLMVRFLAAPFAQHPDFDPAWAVPGEQS